MTISVLMSFLVLPKSSARANRGHTTLIVADVSGCRAGTVCISKRDRDTCIRAFIKVKSLRKQVKAKDQLLKERDANCKKAKKILKDAKTKERIVLTKRCAKDLKAVGKAAKKDTSSAYWKGFTHGVLAGGGAAILIGVVVVLLVALTPKS